jgi:prepilin-type N-terminal cleavage/methylation domain-containing protein
MNTRKNAGFTLIELMIVVAIIAIIASIAIPKLMSARISANENAAIATLRSIASAQAQLESACAIDTDADGGGEFGFFGELSGVAPLRVYDPNTGLPALDAAGLPLDPAILPTPFSAGFLVAGEWIVERAGYYYKMYLPDVTNAGDIAGIAETGPDQIGGATAAAMPNSDNCEILWCCYAWPVEAEATGNRAFFVNQEGDLLQTLYNESATNTVTIYKSTTDVPAFNAAFCDMSEDPNPNSLTGMGASLGITAQGHLPNDGNVWTVVGN